MQLAEKVPDAKEHAAGIATSASTSSRAAPEALRAAARAIDARVAAGEHLPLAGVPFAAKDNIDLAGLETTAACPAFAYQPERSATVIERLEAAGAICVGKTNLDQFATGLVGTRSPYGIPRNAYNRDYVSGGSSSGSAIAVAAGLVAFALGTDTAGSGRVPAAFNHLIGLKPTKGRWSTRGLVPACRTLDCITVFTDALHDAQAVDAVIAGFDAEDAFSRPLSDVAITGRRIGVPRRDQRRPRDLEPEEAQRRPVPADADLAHRWRLADRRRIHHELHP